MTVVVFAGPTISAEELRTHLLAEVRPPVAQGDVYCAVQAGASAIGIVDGYFERVPAVWHKEIFWAISEGIPVYGSASMGALRAAELTAFGMIGVGAIFEAFHSGALEDDDEVAVAHGSEDVGFRGSSEAMVNIRATLALARESSIVTGASAQALIAIAKATYYAERTYPRLIASALEAGLPAPELSALRKWLKQGAVNQKRLDAIAMLARMRLDLSGTRRIAKPQFHFEPTNAWQIAMAESNQPGPPGVGLEVDLNSQLLEEFALFGAYAPIRAAHKQQLLGSSAIGSEAENEAIAWYFAQRLRRTIPGDLDQYATAVGLPNGASFRRAVLREYRYLAAQGKQQGRAPCDS